MPAFLSQPTDLVRVLCGYLCFRTLNSLSATCSTLRADCVGGREDNLRRWQTRAAPLLTTELTWFAGALRPRRAGFATLRYRTVGRRRLLQHAEYDPRLSQARSAVVRAAASWSTASKADRCWYEWYVEQVVRPPLSLRRVVGAWISMLGSVRGSSWSWTRAGSSISCVERRHSHWHLVGVITHTQIWPTSLWSQSASAKVVAVLEGKALRSLMQGVPDSITQLSDCTPLD